MSLHLEASDGLLIMSACCGVQVDASGQPSAMPTQVALVCPRQQAPSPGQEITIDYGDKSNEQLLLNYGESIVAALPCPALPCPALPCPALPCPALPCPALPCPALPCPALPRPAPPCPALPRPAPPCPAPPCPALPCPAPSSIWILQHMQSFC